VVVGFFGGLAVGTQFGGSSICSSVMGIGWEPVMYELLDGVLRVSTEPGQSAV
jgi:hypothetical protein